MSCEPPLFIGDTFEIPLRPSQSHSSKIATTGAPLSRATATRSPM